MGRRRFAVALAVADAAFAAHLNKEDSLVRFLILHDFDIPVLKPFGFVRSEASIGQKENVVVQLFSMPLIIAPCGAVRPRFRVAV